MRQFLDIFQLCGTFFRKLLMSPFHFFLNFFNKIDVKKSKEPPFYSFRHYETVQNSHFSSDIRFRQYINIFFNTIRVFAHDEVNVHCSPAKKVFFPQ